MKYILSFKPPFYYLKKKRKLWFFTYWETIDYSHDFDEMEKTVVLSVPKTEPDQASDFDTM